MTGPALLVRVQDDDGRGPFRPGFSGRWFEGRAFHYPPPFYEEFGVGILDRMRPGYHYGSAVRTLDQLRRWFNDRELAKLMELGYSVVQIDADLILAESHNQVVFGRARPLREGVTAIPLGPV